MRSFIFIFILLTTSAHASLKGTCTGSYQEDAEAHSIRLEIQDHEGALDVSVEENVAGKILRQWSGSLLNRFIFSRVEYYSYEPYYLKLSFPSTTFASAGTFESPEFHDEEKISVVCTYESDKKGSSSSTIHARRYGLGPFKATLQDIKPD